MTQNRSAPADRGTPSRRNPPPAARPLVRGATGLVLGGALIGCVVMIFMMSKLLEVETPTAPVAMIEGSAHRSAAFRVVAAPDHRRFDVRKAAAAVPKTARPHPVKDAPLLSASALLPRFDLARSASLPTTLRRPLRSHRFDAVEFEAAAVFVPAAAEIAQAPVAVAPDRRMAALLPPTDAKIATRVEPKAKVAAAMPASEDDHVEVALPDLPGTEPANPPRNAADALERELALAVPRPTARPFRKLPPAEPTLRHRNRTPAGLLAYARPDAGALDDEQPLQARPLPSSPALSAGTAIYDISAATVYLPNGERLEAHSGLGAMRDNVRYVREKNRGPTPPHTYNLAMRESLFHGVAAIRLHPVGGERNIHNRVGLLAHTYMLGPRGDSNGCVSFKDYKRFLAAFKRGEIRRLVVVPSYKSSSRIASLFGMGQR